MADKHIIFIYSSKNKRDNTVADVASVPLCRVDDKDERVVAYMGALWESQIKDEREVQAKSKIKQRQDYLHLSESMSIENIDKWLAEKGYKRIKSPNIEEDKQAELGGLK